MTLECLNAGDRRKHGLLSDWKNWLGQADELYARFLRRLDRSPFYYNEVASVGFLASAAAMAGFVSLAEYELTKKGGLDKRARVAGRADLWFCSGQRSYSFEFKRGYVDATEQNLRRVLAAAKADISCILEDEYHYAVGGLIAYVADTDKMTLSD